MILYSSKFNSLNRLNHTFRDNAFTLIELLVVIAIIGILSALIIVGMNSTTQKATIAKAQVFSNSLRNSLISNMVAEWKFDGVGVLDGQPATTAYTQDTWSNGNNGTINGAPLVYSGSNCVNGSCLYFDGIDDCILPSSTMSLLASSGYTISFWANIETKANGSMPVGDLSSETKSYIWFFSNGTHVQITGNSEVGMISSDIASIYTGWNQWTFVLSETTATLRRNGVIIITNASPSLNFGVTRIGCGYNGSYFTKGKLDDVRIFNAPMPTSQIQQNYFVGINKLFAKSQITQSDYQQRLASFRQSVGAGEPTYQSITSQRINNSKCLGTDSPNIGKQ